MHSVIPSQKPGGLQLLVPSGLSLCPLGPSGSTFSAATLPGVQYFYAMDVFLRLMTLLILLTSAASFPMFSGFSLTDDAAETPAPVVVHHRHIKHHYLPKHHRRSLASKEEVKVRRSKHMLLTKPYWPWP